MPLWMTTISPRQSRWGWALISLGLPCVAQRVCPMPIVPCGGSRSRARSSSMSLPTLRRIAIRPSSIRARPGIIAAVLKTLQPFENDAGCIPFADIANNSAHPPLPSGARFPAGPRKFRADRPTEPLAWSVGYLPALHPGAPSRTPTLYQEAWCPRLSEVVRLMAGMPPGSFPTRPGLAGSGAPVAAGRWMVRLAYDDVESASLEHAGPGENLPDPPHADRNNRGS